MNEHFKVERQIEIKWQFKEKHHLNVNRSSHLDKTFKMNEHFKVERQIEIKWQFK